MSEQLPPLITLLGPTAAGKTALSLALAERFDGEIVSADSRLIYRGMDIGTAKPTPAEQARVPHHLLDVTTPDRPLTLAEYQR
ncbi:MAG: isopentenyl transferase family protein, partial [Caldilineaceae bacterium]